MACTNVMADSDEEAQYIATSACQAFFGIVRNKRELLPPPVKNMNALWNEYEALQINERLSCSFIGSAETVQPVLQRFIASTGINELMAAAHIFDIDAKLHSYKLFAGIMQEGVMIT